MAYETTTYFSNGDIAGRLRTLGRAHKHLDHHLSDRYERAAEQVENCPVSVHSYYQGINKLPPTITRTFGIEGILIDFLKTLNEGARNGRVVNLDSRT
jgi:hypothetical protein